MVNISRRQLAKYAVNELINGRSRAALSSRLAAALLTSRRQKEVDLLLFDIDKEFEGQGLLTRARVTTTSPLTAELKHSLTSQLKELTGANEVTLQEQLDKSLMGGFRVDTPTRSWDKTLLRALRQLKETV